MANRNMEESTKALALATEKKVEGDTTFAETHQLL